MSDTKRMGKGGRPKGYAKTGGRKKGTRNHVSVEARAAATSIVDDPAYLATLHSRALTGDLPPAIEAMLWAYAKGKPVDRVEVSAELTVRTEEDFKQEADKLTTEQLEAIVQRWDEIEAIKRGEMPTVPVLRGFTSRS
jgi:hypothetical protein